MYYKTTLIYINNMHSSFFFIRYRLPYVEALSIVNKVCESPELKVRNYDLIDYDTCSIIS